MIALFTDFGWNGPYVGQMHAVIESGPAPVAVIDLMHDAPPCNPRAAAHLLAALAPQLPSGTVFVTVVDPGVGTDRRGIVVEADGRWFVGPDNGLLDVVTARADDAGWWRIDQRPRTAFATFHGRDLFAPVGAFLAAGGDPAERLTALPDERPATVPDRGGIIYIDAYGNAMTGLRTQHLQREVLLVTAGGRRFRHARTFDDVGEGEAFWYENSLGLAELAVNRGSAAEKFDLSVGTSVAAEFT